MWRYYRKESLKDKEKTHEPIRQERDSGAIAGKMKWNKT